MKKPLIKLFHTPNRGYCYDAVSSELLPLQEDSFQYLSRLMAGEEPDIEPDEIHQLREKGYLAEESPVKTIQHPYTKYLPLFLNRKLDNITLQVTQNCNFRCKYCIYSEENGDMQRHHSPKRISWETAKQAMDFLWEHSIDSTDISIGFYGGEPLLEFPLICRCVDYARQRFCGKELRFNLTTNSTLITDDMIHFFAENKINIMVSLDGPKEINDKNRVFAGGRGTFDTVMARIARIKELEPEYAKSLRFSMVMDPSNDFDCINSIQLECDTITLSNLSPAIVDHFDDNDPVLYSDEFSSKFTYQSFLAWLAYLGRYPQDLVSPISFQALITTLSSVQNMASCLPLHEIDCPGGPCIAGKMRLFCNVDGDLFPCERVSETSKAMYLGNIRAGFDVNAVLNLLNIGQLTPEACAGCWCFRFCTLCAKKADIGEKSLSASRKLQHCKEARSHAEHSMICRILLAEVLELYRQQLRLQ